MLEKEHELLDGLDALKEFGAWCNDREMWQRKTLPPASCSEASFTVYEDASEAGTNGEYILWASSVMFSRLLGDGAALGLFDLSGATIVEVGAGCGLLSLTAASLGARTVVATEQDTMMPHLAMTLEANRPALSKSCRKGCQISAKPLDWLQQDAHIKDVLAQLAASGQGGADGSNTGGRGAGGGHTGASPTFVIGSDITYNPKLHGPLLDTLVALCSPSSGGKEEERADQPPRTRVLLAHDDTATPLCKTRRAEFFERGAPARGFRVRELDLRRFAERQPAFYGSTVKVFELVLEARAAAGEGSEGGEGGESSPAAGQDA